MNVCDGTVAPPFNTVILPPEMSPDTSSVRDGAVVPIPTFVPEIHSRCTPTVEKPSCPAAWRYIPDDKSVLNEYGGIGAVPFNTVILPPEMSPDTSSVRDGVGVPIPTFVPEIHSLCTPPVEKPS